MSSNAQVAAITQEHELFLKRVHRKKTAIRITRWIILVLFIAFWELAASAGWIDAFIVSSPSRVIKTLQNLWKENQLFNHILATVAETIVGFTAGTVLGTGIAIMLWWSDFAAKVADPYLVVLNSLPKIALGPILIVWIGAGSFAIIAMALLISLIVTVMSVLNGFLEVSQEKVRLLGTFGATKMQVLQKVILPASVPTVISALKINVGMSWVGVIAGEFLVSKQGLGYLIVYGSQVFQLDLVMTSVIVLAVAAALMYQGVSWFEKRYLRWKQ